MIPGARAAFTPQAGLSESRGEQQGEAAGGRSPASWSPWRRPEKPPAWEGSREPAGTEQAELEGGKVQHRKSAASSRSVSSSRSPGTAGARGLTAPEAAVMQADGREPAAGQLEPVGHPQGARIPRQDGPVRAA